MLQEGLQHAFSKKQKLALILTVVFTLFPITYFLAYSGAISPPQTIAINLILSVLTKGFFTSMTMVRGIE